MSIDPWDNHIDVIDGWKIDTDFSDRYTSSEERFRYDHECGGIMHMCIYTHNRKIVCRGCGTEVPGEIRFLANLRAIKL